MTTNAADKNVVFLTVRIAPDVYEEFRTLAASEERTVSQDIRHYIAQRIKRARKVAV